MDFSMVFGVMLSAHVGFCDDCNEVHPFVGLETPTAVEGLTFGGRLFVNSYEDPGLLVGVEYDLGDTGFGLDASLAFGYDEAPVVPFVRVRYDVTDTYSIFAAPVIAEKATMAVHPLIGVEMKF